MVQFVEPFFLSVVISKISFFIEKTVKMGCVAMLLGSGVLPSSAQSIGIWMWLLSGNSII
jgi:hypothetical protein